jgi:hypothetical protein
MAEDKVLARCSCGRERKLTRAKLSKGAKCEGCGKELALEASVKEEEAKVPRAAPDAGLPPPVDPFRLMSGMSGSGFAPTLLIAVGAHVVLLLISSIGFLRLCAHHGTFDIRPVIRGLEKEKVAAEKKRKDQATIDKLKTDKAKAAGAAKKAGGGKPDGADPGAKPGAKKSPVEKRLEEKSNERPVEPTMNLDDALDLE